jgi:hypothetical protein
MVAAQNKCYFLPAILFNILQGKRSGSTGLFSSILENLCCAVRERRTDPIDSLDPSCFARQKS